MQHTIANSARKQLETFADFQLIDNGDAYVTVGESTQRKGKRRAAIESDINLTFSLEHSECKTKLA